MRHQATSQKAQEDTGRVLPPYAIVIATKNRIDALRVSLPLFLGQSCPPARIVLVDHSDDHQAVADLCAGLGRDTDIPIEVIESPQGNLPYQRNLGLDRVDEPVVAFPDDDSFWFEDTAEKLLIPYAQDTGCLIGGVTAIETRVSPLSAQTEAPPRVNRFVQRPTVSQLRRRVESRLIPEPFNLYGQAQIAMLEGPARAVGLGQTFVETVGGFRMSFRTELVRRLRFDEALGARVGYAQHEDKDMSLRVLQAGKLLAAADGARVFHNQHAGRRAGGFAYGFCHIFNYAYACLKVASPGTRAYEAIPVYARYKRFLYGLRRDSQHNRDIHHGATAALAELSMLMAAPPAELGAAYLTACARHLT